MAECRERMRAHLTGVTGGGGGGGGACLGIKELLWACHGPPRVLRTGGYSVT